MYFDRGFLRGEGGVGEGNGGPSLREELRREISGERGSKKIGRECTDLHWFLLQLVNDQTFE